MIVPHGALFDRFADASDEDRTHALMGMAAGVFFAGYPRYPMPLASVMDRWRISMDLGQLDVYVDRAARPVGLVTWLRIDEASEASIIAGTFDFRDPANHRRGERVWVADLVALDHALDAILVDLRDRVWPDEPSVAFARGKHGKRLLLRIDRNPRLSLFRRPSAAPLSAGAATVDAAAAQEEFHRAVRIGCMLDDYRRDDRLWRMGLASAMRTIGEAVAA